MITAFFSLFNRFFRSSAREIVVPKKKPGKKRIVFINHEESLTGAPRVLFEIASSMKKDFDVVVVSLSRGQMHEDFAKTFPVIIYPGESLCGINGREQKAIAVLSAAKPDLVYANTVCAFPYASEAKKMGIPVIFHVHELEGVFRSVLGKQQINSFRNSADFFIAVSDAMRDFLVDCCKCKPSRVVVANAFISCADVLQKSRELPGKVVDSEIKRQPGETLVLALGTAEERKGTDFFVAAHKLLAEKGKGHFRFVWVGDTSRASPEIKKAINSRLPGCVFLGERKNPFPFVKRADIFVLPSREDPFPLVVLEAMALEKPVIAFKNSGCAPVIEKHDCGIVPSEISAIALAKAVAALSSNKKLLKRFFGNCRKVSKKYDAGVILPKIRRIVKKALSKKTR